MAVARRFLLLFRLYLGGSCCLVMLLLRPVPRRFLLLFRAAAFGGSCCL